MTELEPAMSSSSCRIVFSFDPALAKAPAGRVSGPRRRRCGRDARRASPCRAPTFGGCLRSCRFVAAGRPSRADPVGGLCRPPDQTGAVRGRRPDRRASRGDLGFPGSGVAAIGRPRRRVAHRTRPCSPTRAVRVADRCRCPAPVGRGRRCRCPGPVVADRAISAARRAGPLRGGGRGCAGSICGPWRRAEPTKAHPPAVDPAPGSSAGQDRRPPGRDAHRGPRRRAVPGPTAAQTTPKDRLGADPGVGLEARDGLAGMRGGTRARCR